MSLTRLGIGGSSGAYEAFLPKEAGVIIPPSTPSSGIGGNRSIGFESNNRITGFANTNRKATMKSIKRTIGFKS